MINNYMLFSHWMQIKVSIWMNGFNILSNPAMRFIWKVLENPSLSACFPICHWTPADVNTKTEGQG